MDAYTVARSAAVIKPKQPFLDWLKGTPGSEIDISLEQLRLDCTVLLLPEFADPEEAISYLDDIAGEIFEMEVGSWCEDEKAWPADRSLKAFWEWFEVEVHSAVVDLAGED